MKRILFIWCILSGAFFLSEPIKFVDAQSWNSDLSVDLEWYNNMSSLAAVFSQSGENLTLIEGSVTTENVNCVVESCMRFDGSSTLSMPKSIFDFTHEGFTGTNLTINFWFNQAMNAPMSANWLFRAIPQEINIEQVGLTDSLFVDYIGANTLNSGTYTKNTWIMLTITRNQTNACLWFDGEIQDCELSASGNFITEDITMASNIAGGSHDFIGLWDEFGIWSRPLNSLEISQLYNNGNGLTFSGDLDGDGFFQPVDCNDNDPLINPNAIDICDFIDNNCDGQLDSASVCREFICDDNIDNDRDGFIDLRDQDCSGLQCKIISDTTNISHFKP